MPDVICPRCKRPVHFSDELVQCPRCASAAVHLYPGAEIVGWIVMAGAGAGILVVGLYLMAVVIMMIVGE